MRPLNFGFFAVVGAFGAASSCGPPEQPDIEPGGEPFPTGGTRPVPTVTATPTPTGGSGGRSSTGGSSSKTATGGRSSSSTGGSTGCPMEAPDDNDACTLPASGSLKCTFGDTTCTCLKSTFSGKTTWDCRTATTSTGGRSSSGTGGRSSGSGGSSSGGGSAGKTGF